jgi:hypothetical protein
VYEAQETTRTLPAEFFPDAVPAAGLAPLGYARPYAAGRVGESGFGIASCVLCLVTLVYSVVCAVGMTQAKGWDVLGWMVVGFIGNWVGCGLGFLFGLVGVVQTRRGRRWAIHGMWLNGALVIAPLVVFSILAQK